MPRAHYTTRMYLFRTLLFAGILTAVLIACESEPLPSADPSTTLIDNVTIIDGSGSPRSKGAVRIMAGEIIAVGKLEKLPGEAVIDGGGQVLAPGFIDTHSHADEELFDQPGALAAVSQGITTIVIGQDGHSPFPLLDFRFRLLDMPVAVNIAAFSGHNTIRRHVMRGDYQRHASAPETRVMAQFLREDLQAGALGLSTGLAYDPGIYSSFDELAALAAIAAEQGGRYISQVRSEDRRLEEAMDEIIEIGRQVDIPVQISHFKLAMMPLWGRAAEIIQTLNEARSEGVEITADIYPYPYWQSNMQEEDIKALMNWPHSNICSDGALDDMHPRGAGAFPRVLGRYVREMELMSLEDAVHKMTGLSAQHMGFKKRGVIRPGAVADLVLFDPETVIDNATPQEPARLSTGISKVWVNGWLVFDEGSETGLRPGRFIGRL